MTTASDIYKCQSAYTLADFVKGRSVPWPPLCPRDGT